MKVGFFGGSFNPPHLGHILAATYALKVYNLDEVWIAPVYYHPFAKNIIEFEHRLAMCKLLVEKLSPPLQVTDIEKHVNHEGKTLFTLRELKKKYPKNEFSLIIGSDLKDQLKTWNNIADLKKEFPIVIVPRGLENDPTSIPNISSTNVRRETYSDEQMQRILTPEIYEYMKKQKIY